MAQPEVGLIVFSILKKILNDIILIANVITLRPSLQALPDRCVEISDEMRRFCLFAAGAALGAVWRSLRSYCWTLEPWVCHGVRPEYSGRRRAAQHEAPKMKTTSNGSTSDLKTPRSGNKPHKQGAAHKRRKAAINHDKQGAAHKPYKPHKRRASGNKPQKSPPFSYIPLGIRRMSRATNRQRLVI
jgi:hypothetical protein